MTLDAVKKKKKDIEETLSQLNKNIHDLTIEYIELTGVEKHLEGK